MAVLRSLHLVVLWAAVSFCMAFNIDVAGPKIYNGSGPRADFFGYKALHFQSGTEKGFVVSAPLQRNGTGGVFICDDTSPDCKPVLLPNAAEFNSEGSIKAVGMSVAVRATPTLQFTACSPAWSHECDGTPYLNSICYQWNRSSLVSNITSAFKECTKQKVDLVFLFDGSLSMKPEDWKKNKEFIKTIMNSMSNTSIQFAAVQFSKVSRTVFTFKDYQDNKAFKKLDDEEHMKSLTNTHGAMHYALTNLFDESESGRHPDATKVVVIITDGNPSDPAKVKVNGISKLIVEVYEDRHIMRFVIAVGAEVKMDKLRLLASEPKFNNSFYIDDYSGLAGLLDNLQTKIFNIEGSKHTMGQTWEKELSQSGMSAEYIEDTLILGSVGSHNSKGSLYQIEGKGSPEKEIQDPEMQDDSYMGYSVAVGKKNGIPLYFTGAPRYKHRGQVIVFSRTTGNWTVIQRLDNEQIGSYFGAELCAVDIDSDGTTDFLMVGAPLHYHPQREGQMYVFALTRENKLVKMQNISESSKGRFASSIASLRDLNGDELQDLAVGAPLEDEHRGAVYIYLGDKTMGIRQKYSQRIRAKMLSEGLQQFGVTIDGKSDMDGLTEIAVGARGQVVLLRSRPVFNVSAHLSFNPPEISTQQFDCNEHKEAFPTVTLTICFKMSEETKSTKDVLSTGLTLDYDLMLDSQRKNSRGFLAAKNITLRSIQPRLHLNKTEMCQNHTIYMPSCVMDTLSPVKVKVNFSQAESQQPRGILNVDSKREAVVEVPFERSCGHNATCVAKLQLDFNFTSPALLVFTDQDYLYVRVALSNVGDDSYNTSLHFHYPKGLSHSKLDVIKQNKRTLTRCDGDPDKTDLTICSVSLPVFRSQNWAVFNGSFHITSSLKWNDFITMTITAHSDNGDPKDIPLSKTLPVLLAVDLAVTFMDTPGASTTYVDYSLEDRGPKTLTHMYRVANIGMVPLPVTVKFTFPTKPGNYVEIQSYNISQFKVNYTIQCSPPQETITQNCSKVESCKMVECHIPKLDRSESVLFTLTVSAAFNLNPNKYIFTEMRFNKDYKSFVEINYNKTRFIQTRNDQTVPGQVSDFHRTQGVSRAEFIVPINKPLIIGLAGAGGLLLLIFIIVVLIKCGFFKRNKFGEEGEGDQDFGEEEDPETPGTVVTPPEAKPLMSEDSKENGSSPMNDYIDNPVSEKTDAQCEE
ncbi:integrin alpha-M-like [Clupea harengus]|uniref:Integrin alpha-M-like n=1 Tax=Clupea harengus TaxID=7950 RepID=A0A6P8EUK5_CLUHA|nr:integrin alpha-M-like [Clupea harengus]